MMRPRLQSGFSLVSALFLLIVLSSLGAFMVSISGTQHTTVLHALQGAKAYHAARSGLEWGIDRALNGGGACNSGGPMALGGGLAGLTVTVTCAVTNHTERGSPVNVFSITAFGQTTGVTLGQPGYAARRLTITVTDAP
jgi:MSHA biogenesis protein MshP